MQNLVDRKELDEKETTEVPFYDLSAISLNDLQAALACHTDWGVSEIFDDLPGISVEKSESGASSINPFSLLSQRSVGLLEEKRASSIREFSKTKPLSETTFSLLETPPKARILAPPAAHISMEALTQKLQETKTVEEALACARSFGGAGLAHTALNDIKGSIGIAGGGFLVSSEISQESERAGKVLVGEEGLLMTRLFASVGLSLEHFGSAPALPWRPPGGRDPLPEEVEACIPLLRQIISLSAPKWIVTFGSLSARMLLEGDRQGEAGESIKDRFLRPSFRLSQVRGRWHEISLMGAEKKIKIFPFMAPSRLKNSVRMRQSMWRDLQVFKQGLLEILEK